MIPGTTTTAPKASLPQSIVRLLYENLFAPRSNRTPSQAEYPTVSVRPIKKFTIWTLHGREILRISTGPCPLIATNLLTRKYCYALCPRRKDSGCRPRPGLVQKRENRRAHVRSRALRAGEILCDFFLGHALAEQRGNMLKRNPSSAKNLFSAQDVRCGDNSLPSPGHTLPHGKYIILVG